MTNAKLTASGSTKTLLTATAFKEYAEVLSRYLLHRVRRPEDAEDLAQEVFEHFLRKRDSPEPVRDPLAYLFRIAFHVVGLSLKKAQRSPVTFDSSLLEGRDSLNPGGQSTLEDQLALKDELAKALANLPENHVLALMLVERDGMSHKEAAEIMGLSVNSVAMYVSRGRAELALALTAERKDSKASR
jgi:RNA polymerase sigma factor (sigma-70 family)